MQAMNMRKSEKDDRTYFRTERFSLVNGAWYFQTREQSLGPFSNRKLAEDALQNFLVELSALKNFEESRRLARIIRVADSRNRAKQSSSEPTREPLIEVVEEYRVERRSEPRVPAMDQLTGRPQSSNQDLSGPGIRLTLVPVDK